MPAKCKPSRPRGGRPDGPARLVTWLLLALLLPGAAWAEDKPAEKTEKKKSHLRWYVVPNLAYDSDDGLGYGGRGELAVAPPGYFPYRTAYVLHIFLTNRGYHHHRIRFDRTGLGPGRRLRVTAHLAWRQWLNDGYWGIGNSTAREREYVGSFDDDDPARKRYRYTLYQPFCHITLRARITKGWALYAALNPKYSIVRTYEGSLLSEQRPYGMDGGFSMPIFAGILYDSRRPEADPQQGIFAEVGGRIAGVAPHGAGAFGGLTASVRGYLGLTRWLVLAGRLMGEMLFGEIPFYEMVHWGGSVPVTGFGGFETLRGVSFGRWRAPGKAVLNTEARFKLFEHTVFKRPLYWQLALIFDAGAVFGAGDRATGPPGSSRLPVHPAGGLGIRAVFQETFVGRIDTGVGIDPVREADGSETLEPSFGIYVVFDQAF